MASERPRDRKVKRERESYWRGYDLPAKQGRRKEFGCQGAFGIDLPAWPSSEEEVSLSSS